MRRIIRPETLISHVYPGAMSPSLEASLLEVANRQGPYRIEALVDDSFPPFLTFDALLEATRGEAVDSPSPTAGAIRDEVGVLVGQRIPVWPGASGQTIWSSPEVNWVMRAVEDSLHLSLIADFDEAGELRVARALVNLVARTEVDRNILWADTRGQDMYFRKWGAHPIDQRSFVQACLFNGVAQTVVKGGRHEGQDKVCKACGQRIEMVEV